MSERVANKLKQLTLAKRTTRERMQSLIETRMPSEGFTVDDFRELYSKHASLILALYQEFMTTVDGEATSKGKLLSTIEAGNVMFVLKDLMIYNASKIAHGDGWELPFFLKELPCFLHQETHIIVRRQGVDALATLISLRAAAAPAASSMEEGSSDGVAATLVPLMHLLLSSLDWEFLRTTYGSVTTLPNIISGDVRRGRHDCLPPRARYSATSNGADERLRETTAMLKRLIVESLTDKPDSPLSSPQALQLWTNYFHHHIAPLFTPTIALASGLVHGATLHGFLSGVHPVVHGVLVDLIAQLTSPQRDDLVKSGRLLQTIAATSAGAKFVIGILTEAVRNPSVETAAFNLKALTLWSTCLRQLGGAVAAETSTSFSTAAFVALPEVRQHVYWWLGNVLGGSDGDNTIHVAATLLSLQVQNCEASSATSSALPSLAPSPLVVLGSLQGLVEAYAEWMMLVASSGATSAASSVASASQGVPIAIREQAVNRLAVLAAELSVEAASKSSPHLDEVIPYTVQAFWVAAVSTVPLYGSVFLGSVHPVLCEMERRLKHTPSAAAATTALYMVRSWVAVVQHHVKVLIAPTHSKLVPFTWPSTSNTQSISGTAAASSPLLEYRLKRCPIIVEGATRAVASLLSGTFAQHAEVSPFVATFEAFHNLLANFEQDTYTTQQAKTSATVDALRVLIDHSRNWSGQLPTSPHQKHSDPTATPMAPPVLNTVLPIEPDSLLKVFAPYLLLQSRLSESSTSAKSSGASGGLIKPATLFSSSVTSTTTPSGGSSGQRWMAGVAKDALETLCEIISLATAERWGPSIENEVESDNTLYDTESAPPVKPQLPMTPVLSAVVLDRLREVLHSIRSGELLRTDHLCGDVPGRMIAALFRNATTEILLGKPSSHFLCSTNAAMPYGMLDELEASALWVLNRFPTEGTGAVTSPNSGDVFTAALTCLMWTLSVDRRAEAPLAPRASDFATSLRAAFTATASSQSKQQKQFILHLVKTTSLTVSMLLRSAASGNKETQSTGSADRARLQEAVVTCVELLIAQYNPLDKFIVPHLHGALHFVIEILEDALKPTATTNIDKRQVVLSREFYLLLYRRMMTALCGVAMYHAYNWTRTQNTGDGLVQVIYLIGELSTRIGHVHLCSYHADDERRYGVSLAQLMSDVVAMTQSGSPQHCKYSLGFPGSAQLQRRHVIAVSRVQSAYQLMQDALEAQSRGSAITAASTDTYAQVMVPPLDQSARQWFGANTPSPTDVQADTLHPQQVVQAGAELYSALCLHTTAFPLTITDSSSGTSLEITDGTTAVEVSMAAEHTAHFLVGNGATAVSSTRRQQVLSVHTEALRGDVVHVQVGSAVESSGWTLQPAQQCLTGPNTSLKDTSVVTKQLVVTRQVGVLEPTLELFLDDFRSTRLPPAELLQTQNSITSDWNEDVKEATVEHNSAIIAAGLSLLAVPRKSSAGSLVDFKKAAPPTTSKNAPVPRSELNHAFSFLHSIGAVDGLEPLVQQRTFSKFGANINDGDNGSTVVTLTKPGVHWDAVVPSEVYVPLAPRSLISSVVASTAATDATSGLANASSVQSMLQQQDLTPNDDAVAALHAVQTRTLIPPLPCLARTSAGSRTTVTKLQEAVYRAFGTLNDDGTSSRACTSRHELVLLDASSLDHAFTRSDAVLFFAGNFSDVLAATRDVRQLLAGRSFAALFVVPNPVVANGVTIHLARQGEGAPLFSPIVDGACLSVESAGLLLRAALLSSMLPWKQPLTIAEAKRRVSQRPTRTFLMDGLAAKDVNQLLSSASTKRAAGRSASPRPASGASPLSTVVTSTSGPSPSPHSQQSSPGPNNNNSSFAGNNNSPASVARFVSPGQDASTMTATAWTLQLAASGW